MKHKVQLSLQYILHSCELVLHSFLWLRVKILLHYKNIGGNCLKILSPSIMAIDLITDSYTV